MWSKPARAAAARVSAASRAATSRPHAATSAGQRAGVPVVRRQNGQVVDQEDPGMRCAPPDLGRQPVEGAAEGGQPFVADPAQRRLASQEIATRGTAPEQHPVDKSSQDQQKTGRLTDLSEPTSTPKDLMRTYIGASVDFQRSCRYRSS